jgi:hypothetical protein
VCPTGRARENRQSALFSNKKETVSSEWGIPLAATLCQGFDDNVGAVARTLWGRSVPAQALRRNACFGAVSRAHPVDHELGVLRPWAVGEIVEVATELTRSGGHLLVLGPPGHGKSWICQQVLDALSGGGWLTAEHYCYLGDADAPINGRAGVRFARGRASRNQSPEGADMALAYSEANCLLSGYCSLNSWNNLCARAFCFSRRAARARMILANGRR